MLQDAPPPLTHFNCHRPKDLPAAYLHIPFCFHKCHYCDFFSIVDNRDRQATFTDRLIDEINAWRGLIPRVSSVPRVPQITPEPRPLACMFVGGGTPTLLEIGLWGRLLKQIGRSLPLDESAEFTVEANPETVTADLMAVLAEGGVNRISMGAQLFDRGHLAALERWHEPDSVARAVEITRAAGIDNINLDLIFAIPGQTPDHWQADLRTALSLEPTHLSCYGLTYESNTPLTKKLEVGKIDRCDETIEAQMYEMTIDLLADAGFEHYEVSNWAKWNTNPKPQIRNPNESQADNQPQPIINRKSKIENRKSHRCRHNMTYWLNENWLALGPSASGHIDGVRWKNIPHLGQYLESTGPAPAIDIEQLDPDRSLGEQLMLRLRLIEGAELAWLEPLLNADRRSQIAELQDRGLLEQTQSHLRLTRRGLLLADDVIWELL